MEHNPDRAVFDGYLAMAYRERHPGIESVEAQEIHNSMSLTADRALTMWVEKVKGYGLGRYKEDDWEFNLWMCFSDIYRKFIRLRTLTSGAMMGDPQTVAALRDAYADLAVYALSNLVILEKSYGDNGDAS
jgi:hypothetical protein